MTDFTNIRTALDNLIAVLDSTVDDIVGTANEQRKELLALYGRMQATQADLHELGSMMGDAGAAMLDLEELCEDVSSKMQGVLEGGIDETPVSDYEVFVGFCADCGDEIIEGEEYAVNEDNGFLCANCSHSQAGQLTFDLAESVGPASDTDAE